MGKEPAQDNFKNIKVEKQYRTATLKIQSKHVSTLAQNEEFKQFIIFAIPSIKTYVSMTNKNQN